MRRIHISTKTIYFLLILFAIATVLISIGIGPVNVPAQTVAKIIGSKIPFLNDYIIQDWTVLQENIVWGLRFPRVALGFVVGASLAVTGVTMQALVRNHLADPFILGVSSGASATATLGMLFGTFSFLGVYSLSLSAFIGAAISITLVYTISRVNGRIDIKQLLLSGVVISMIMEAITKIITLSAPNALGLHNAQFWMSGSLAGAKWAYLTLPLIVIFISMTFLMVQHRALNALLMGDDTAATLGVNVSRMQKMLVLVASLLAGVTIAVSGSIGFVGLMVPHICRLLVGSDHKKVLPLCVILGGILVVWTDVAARMLIAPEELPIGVLTALVGGPFFIWLLKRKSKE
ncbi:iron chelate uptake ABC transporter family permease subunit [Alkalibaculum sp. M08DMB]|uniref:Iron chelate uptake ABC transporter family permease subunit n=1 Tax=Alkalibaculum sporogenes TaxID=2655001 RepID=A0A6A7K7U5_9FIRM|nr:iron ABC transporter permease [Alkalibaculum sporogenes]MPW25558.1 iron chelate uptake ABC transporter family permease subunit [Alkalibaculum sporogenes]